MAIAKTISANLAMNLFMRAMSAIRDRAIDVVGHRRRRHRDAVILAKLAAVRAEQETRRDVVDGAIGLTRALDFENRKVVVDLRRRPGEKNPIGAVGAMRVGIFEELRRIVMLGIERDRHEADLLR